MRLDHAMQMIKEVVDMELRRFFAAKRKEARSVHPALVELVDQIADVTLRGGKRIRPFLCWVGYSAMLNDKCQMPNKISTNVKCAMMGLELFQTFAIIHDDIMDEDSKRRGGPTIHRYFNAKRQMINAKWEKQGRFGESMGVLAGDLALAWADEQIEKVVQYSSSDPAPSDGAGESRSIQRMFSTSSNNIHILALYQHMKEEVIYGQTLDVMRSIGVKDIEKGRVDELKTAYYSVARPLQIGSSLAISGSPSRSQSPPGRWPEDSFQVKCFEVWERFGVPVGKLFQLRDDFLDDQVTGELFQKEARQLTGQAIASIEALDTSDEVKQLLADLVAFVQNRNS